MTSSPLEQYRFVRKVGRILAGPAAQTPTPTIMKVFDIGMLHFLNEKQSQIHQVLANADPRSAESLGPLRSLLEFISFVVGGLIMEAEKIDEAVLNVRRELSELAADLRRADLELQHRKRHVGTNVVQTIAHHYNSRIIVPERKHRAFSDQVADTDVHEVTEHTNAISGLRDEVKVLKAHLKVLLTVQRLLHGKQGIPAFEASAIVADTGVLVAFRKCNHKVRDAIFDAPRKEQLTPVTSLLEFILYLDCGMTAALDDLESCEIALKRECLAMERDTRNAKLARQDTRNKQMSTSALHQNQELSQIPPSTFQVPPPQPPPAAAPDTSGMRAAEHPLPSFSTPHQPATKSGGLSEMDELLRQFCS